MSKILANQIANYGDDAPIEIKEGLNIPTGKPIQAAGVSGTSGQVLTSTGASISWTTPFNGDYNSLTNLPTIPAAQVNSDWNATSGAARILNKPVVPPQPSVTTNAAGTAALSYNSVNGQFTYTPPDLSGFADGTNEANWDTAYGWGDHAAAGYLTAEVDTLQTVTSRGATTDQSITIADDRYLYFGTHLSIRNRVFNGTFNYGEINHTGDSLTIQSNNFVVDALGGVNMLDAVGGGGVRIYYSGEAKLETTTEGVTITGSVGNNNLSVYGDALVFGGLNAGGLAYPITSGNVGQILTSDGAGNVVWGSSSGGGTGIALSDLSVTTNPAGSAALTYSNISGVFTYTPPDLSGYLTSYTETDPVFSISPAASISTIQINNWNSAYSWGDHSAQGYLTSYTETDPVFAASDAAAVTAAGISNWDTAYGWGDHAAVGYLTTQASVALNDVSDVTIISPTNGDVLTYNGSAWVNSASSAVVTISDTLPGGTPNAGDLWWESDKGRLKIYYQDTDSAQWVDASPPLQQDRIASTGAPATATSTGTAGEIKYDSDYVYICVATNTWKRSALATW